MFAIVLWLIFRRHKLKNVDEYGCGRYYLYKYVYTGYRYGKPPFPKSASSKACMVPYTKGSEDIYVLLDNKWFYDYEWDEID
jgi:hypothetical protein